MATVPQVAIATEEHIGGKLLRAGVDKQPDGGPLNSLPALCRQ